MFKGYHTTLTNSNTRAENPWKSCSSFFIHSSPTVCSVVLDVKSKSLNVAVVCGPVLAGLQMLLLTNFVASCRHDIRSRVHSIAAIMLTKLYDVSVVFTLLHEWRRHQIEVGLLGKATA